MPVADFNYSPIKPVINIDQQVVFTDASWGTTIASWNWYFMNTAQYTSIEQNPTFTYPEAGTYPIVLVVKNDRGCSDTIIKSITVSEDFGIYIPDAFTPNGDGLNDIFQPKGFGIVKYEMEIFDRWGEQLFTTKDFNEGWKGTNSRGQILKEDIYAWKIILTNVYSKSEEYTGHVSLMK
jgi:gliding motility-associated-like protein